jgi:hypothetical protein
VLIKELYRRQAVGRGRPWVYDQRKCAHAARWLLSKWCKTGNWSP